MQTHDVRSIEKEEVEKMLLCKEQERGCFVCYCRKCDKYITVPLECNSRLCSSCGKTHTDKWSEKLVKKLFPDVIHRHLIFSISEMLWGYVKKNRDLQRVILDASSNTIQEMFSEIAKKKINVGIVSVLHPFGKDLGFKPHPHNIVTEGGFTKNGKFISIGRYINYNALHKKWQYELLEALRGYIPSKVIDLAYRKYPNGFHAHVKPERISSKKRLIKYIGRYIKHPAIANSRIEKYNGEAVRFYYKDHNGKIYKKVMLVDEFISAIIQHIPNKNQRLIRYYGTYARRKVKAIRIIVKQLTIKESILRNNNKNRTFTCPYCKKNGGRLLFR